MISSRHFLHVGYQCEECCNICLIFVAVEVAQVNCRVDLSNEGKLFGFAFFSFSNFLEKNFGLLGSFHKIKL